MHCKFITQGRLNSTASRLVEMHTCTYEHYGMIELWICEFQEAQLPVSLLSHSHDLSFSMICRQRCHSPEGL